MTTDEFKAYLKKRYEYDLDWYDRKARRNKFIYNILQWILIILSAITPVLIELRMEIAIGSDRFVYVATIFGVLVAILTAGLKTFKYQESWINYRTTCETLRKEQYYYQARLGDYRDAADREAVFVDRVEALISRENTMWLTTRKPEKDKEESKTEPRDLAPGNKADGDRKDEA